MRTPIDDKTMKHLEKCASGLYGRWKRDAARTIIKQKWISAKQKRYIFSMDFKYPQRNRHEYDGPPDNYGNGYVTGE